LHSIAFPTLDEVEIDQIARCGGAALEQYKARQTLIQAGERDFGSRYSQGTFRVRDFLARNRVLFTWLDLENDPQVNQILKEFGLSESDTPVVACAHKLLLRNPSNRERAEVIGLRQPVEHEVYERAASTSCASTSPCREARSWPGVRRPCPRRTRTCTSLGATRSTRSVVASKIMRDGSAAM